jgi:hypothetical protein
MKRGEAMYEQPTAYRSNITEVIDMKDWSVWLYLCDRVFGGHEEGGWYFDAGEPVMHPCNRKGMSGAQAERYRSALDGVVKELNEDRPDVDSVVSEGQYRFRIVPDGQAVSFPEERPYYE